MNSKTLNFIIVTLILLSTTSCQKNAVIDNDTARLKDRAVDFTSFQYDFLALHYAKKITWNHFKFDQNRLFFDSIPDRFQFEEKNAEKIQLVKDFSSKLPIKLIEKGGNEREQCVYFSWPGSLSGIVSKDSIGHQWILDPNIPCNDNEYFTFINEYYALFDKLNL